MGYYHIYEIPIRPRWTFSWDLFRFAELLCMFISVSVGVDFGWRYNKHYHYVMFYTLDREDE